MRPDVLQRLLDINARFYRDFGAAFSATRQRVQPGVKRLLETLPLTGRWLDIGCGNGELGRELQRRGFAGEYWGVDASREMLGEEGGGREEAPHPLTTCREGENHGEMDARGSPHLPAPLSVNGEGVRGVRYAATTHPAGKRSEPSGETPDVNLYPFDITRPNLWLSHPALWEKLKSLAREMRHKPTPAEKILWQRVRDRQVNNAKFRRQHAIGQFLVDYYCAEVHLAIEVDGPIHQYTAGEDAIRQEFLETMGITVLRFTNEQVIENLRTVLKEIGDRIIELRHRSELPHPLTTCGEEGGRVRYAANTPPARKPKTHLLRANLADPAWTACLPPGRYETITAFAVLHHIPSGGLRERLLRQVAELLAPGGRFILSVWQFQHSPRLMARRVGWEAVGLAEADLEPGDTLLDWRFALPGQAEQRGLRYVHLFTLEELAALAAATGFSIRQTFESDGHGGRLGLYQVWERAG